MIKSFLLNLLFPIECLGCGQEGDWICTSCFHKLKFSGNEKKSKLITPDIDEVFLAGDYDDPLLAAALKKFKYNFITALGPQLARFLVMFWQGVITSRAELKLEPGNDFAPLVAFIPLTKKRERWRGFNQSEIIAREFVAAFGYDCVPGLTRRRSRQTQASLDETDRLNNLQGAFRWRGADLSAHTIILIDDVITTGSTMNEAAKILRAAGAQKIYGLAVAKG